MVAAAAKLLQSCLTLCDPIDGSPPGSPVPGILQARTLEWGAIFFSNAWKWKSFSHVRLLATPRTAAHQAPPSMGFSRQESGVGCHCLLSLWPTKLKIFAFCPLREMPADWSNFFMPTLIWTLLLKWAWLLWPPLSPAQAKVWWLLHHIHAALCDGQSYPATQVPLHHLNLSAISVRVTSPYWPLVYLSTCLFSEEQR